jgi:hypothetical protein
MAAANDQNLGLRSLGANFLPRKIRFCVKTKVKDVIEVGQEASDNFLF